MSWGQAFLTAAFIIYVVGVAYFFYEVGKDIEKGNLDWKTHSLVAFVIWILLWPLTLILAKLQRYWENR